MKLLHWKSSKETWRLWELRARTCKAYQNKHTHTLAHLHTPTRLHPHPHTCAWITRIAWGLKVLSLWRLTQLTFIDLWKRIFGVHIWYRTIIPPTQTNHLINFSRPISSLKTLPRRKKTQARNHATQGTEEFLVVEVHVLRTLVAPYV